MRPFKQIIGDAVRILPADSRKGVVSLVPLLLLQALLDTASVASLAPLALVILEPGSEVVFLNRLGIGRAMPGRTTSVAIFVSLAALFFVTKHFAGMWISHRKLKTAYRVADLLSQKMAGDFLGIGYDAYLELQTGGELNRIANLPQSFANNMLLALATLLTEGLIVVLMCMVLLLYDWRALLFLGLLAFPAAWYYKHIQNKLRNVSQALNLKYTAIVNRIIQLFRSFVEIRLYQKEDFFKDEIRGLNRELIDAQVMQGMLQVNSYRLFETTAALGLCLLVLYLTFTGASQESAILLLGLYTACGFRAIPSFNRMFTALIQVRSNEYTLDGLNHFKPQALSANAGKVEFERTLAIQNMQFAYPGKTEVLSGITFTIRKGEKVALAGKSGSGKTTLLLLIMQYLKPTAGSIQVDGLELKDQHQVQWQRFFSYVPQNPVMLNASLSQNIAFGMGQNSLDETRITELLEQLGLGAWLNSLPEGLNTSVGEHGIKLSGGQRQRIAVARALYHDAAFLILDEATSHLDSFSKDEILRVLNAAQQKGSTIIMVTHDESVFRFFDRVVTLDPSR